MRWPRRWRPAGGARWAFRSPDLLDTIHRAAESGDRARQRVASGSSTRCRRSPLPPPLCVYGGVLLLTLKGSLRATSPVFPKGHAHARRESTNSAAPPTSTRSSRPRPQGEHVRPLDHSPQRESHAHARRESTTQSSERQGPGARGHMGAYPRRPLPLRSVRSLNQAS